MIYDRDIALDKRGIWISISYFSMKTSVVGTQNHLTGIPRISLLGGK